PLVPSGGVIISPVSETVNVRLLACSSSIKAFPPIVRVVWRRRRDVLPKLRSVQTSPLTSAPTAAMPFVQRASSLAPLWPGILGTTPLPLQVPHRFPLQLPSPKQEEH